MPFKLYKSYYKQHIWARRGQRPILTILCKRQASAADVVAILDKSKMAAKRRKFV